MTEPLLNGQSTLIDFAHIQLKYTFKPDSLVSWIKAIISIRRNYKKYCISFAKYAETAYYKQGDGNPEWVAARALEVVKRKVYLNKCIEAYELATK